MPFMQQKPVPEQIEENVQHAVEQAQQEVTRSRNPWYVVSKRGRIFVLIYIIEFALFTLLAWFVHIHPVVPVDVVITQEFQENKALWLQTAMIAVSYLGNAQFVFVALILLTAAAFWMVRLQLEALL